MARVPTTNVKDTILVQIPDGNIGFRILKSKWESEINFLCPANNRSYSKASLIVAQTYD